MSVKNLTQYKRERVFAKYKANTKQGLKDADAILKTLPYLDLLLDAIEEIENSDVYRHKLKQTGNAFKKELVRSLGFLHNTDEETQQQAFWVMDQVEKVDELIGNTHMSKFPLLIKIIQEFHKIDEADVETFVGNITTRQYAYITEFVLPKEIIGKLKKIMPMIEEMPLIQVSQQISRQQLQNTKGFGEESIKILNEVFATSGIKW